MLGFEHKHGSNSMTLPSKGQTKLSEDEWKEMAALKDAINQLPQSVSPEKMETFTEYLVRSLRERGG
jgi:hypothetical protein